MACASRLLLFSLLAACGMSSGAPPKPTPEVPCAAGAYAPLPMEDFIAAYAQVSCQQLDACPLVDQDLALNLSAWSAARGCIATQVDFLERSASVQDLFDLVRAGVVTYVPNCARAALDRMAVSCSVGLAEAFETQGLFPRGAFAGTVEPGGTCRRDEQCAGDAYCSSSADCPGVCTPRKPPSAPCTSPHECADGAKGPVFCHGSCAEWQGDADAPLGAECWAGADCHGTRCVPSCAAGWYCADPICRAPLTTGAACTEDDLCERDSICLEGHCVPIAFVGEGERCVTELSVDASDPGGPVAYCNPYEHVHCVAGRCVSLGDGSAGSDCRDSIFADPALTGACQEGLTCEPGTRQCIPIEVAGAPCDFDFQCASETCRDGTCSAEYCAL